MQINPLGNDIFKEVNFAHSVTETINANSAKQFTIDTYSCPSGYYPIGYKKIEVGNYKAQLEMINVTPSFLYIRIGNLTSSAITVNTEVTVVFAKINTI